MSCMHFTEFKEYSIYYLLEMLAFLVSTVVAVAETAQGCFVIGRRSGQLPGLAVVIGMR